VKRLLVVLALSACTESEHMAVPATPVSQAPAEGSLSDGASKIVAALRLRPDIDKICGGGETFRGAMRGTVIKLVISGEINDNPRQDAESAAAFLHAHCGQPGAVPASAVTSSASPSSR
jgi:hypothetical protein